MSNEESGVIQEHNHRLDMPGDEMGSSDTSRGDTPIEDPMGEGSSRGIEPTQRIQPQDITLSHHDGTLKVDWYTAPNGYEVVLCKGNQDIESKESINPPAFLPTDSLSAGEYCVKVKVRSHDSRGHDYIDDEPCIPGIVKLETPSNISLLLDKDNETPRFRVSWEGVNNATSYQVQIVQVLLLEQVEPFQGVKSHDFDVSSLDRSGMSYQAWVQAKGDEQHINSNIGKSLIVSPLPAPENIRQSYNGKTKELIATWDRVANASGYLAQVVSLDAQEVVKDLHSAQTSCTFDSTQFTQGGAGAYQIWVKAIGSDRFLDSPLGKAEMRTPRLAAPTDVRQSSTLAKDSQKTLLSAQFTGVAGAKDYYAEVVNVDKIDTVVASTSKIDPTGTIPPFRMWFETREFPGEDEIHYQVRVKAIGDEQTLDSTFSSATPVLTRLATPKNLTLENSNSGMVVTAKWDAVTHATGYHVQVVDVNNNNQVVIQQKIDSQEQSSASLDKTQFTGNSENKYQVWVKSLGSADQYLDSAFVQKTF